MIQSAANPRPLSRSASGGFLTGSVLSTLRFYKRWISPLLPSACRFHPTCSVYMMEAIQTHGLARGLWMGLRRIGRCQPFCQGGFDPVR